MMKNKVLRFWFRQFLDLLLAFGLSVFVTFFFIGDSLFQSPGNMIVKSLYGFTVGISIWKISQFAGYLIKRKFSWEHNPRMVFKIHLTTAIIVAAVVIIFVNWIYHNFIYHRPFSFGNRFILIEMVVEMGITLIITTAFYSVRFFSYWRQAVINEEKYKREALALQYETLKSYINPHFLFNSLSVLSSLIDTDKEQSQTFIRQLSGIFRYVLEQKDKELVPLETELHFAENYIALHKIRHGESLEVEMQIDDYTGYLVPLSMQILLENVFKHNIISKERPLHVSITRISDDIVIANPFQKKEVHDSNGFGISTLLKQYAFFTDRALFIENGPDQFIVKIPVLQLNEA